MIQEIVEHHKLSYFSKPIMTRTGCEMIAWVQTSLRELAVPGISRGPGQCVPSNGRYFDVATEPGTSDPLDLDAARGGGPFAPGGGGGGPGCAGALSLASRSTPIISEAR